MPGLIERLLMKWVPYVDIAKEVEGGKTLYLRRFFLRKDQDGRGNIYLHKIYRSDEDRDPHDHPWDWKTLILKGGYRDEQWEWDGSARRFLGHQICKPFRIFSRSRYHLHRLQLHPGKTAWTIVWTSERHRVWTFVTEAGPVPWHKYLGVNPRTYQSVD